MAASPELRPGSSADSSRELQHNHDVLEGLSTADDAPGSNVQPLNRGTPNSSSSTKCRSAGQSSSTSESQDPPYFGSHAVDHAVAGIGAGAVATVCMNPLDLLKVKFQVDTRPMQPLSLSMLRGTRLKDVVTGGKVGREIYASLRAIVQDQGWKGLYRGLSPNVIGNSASWGLYFLWYTMLKDSMSRRDQALADSLSTGEGSAKPIKLSASQHLLAASISGGATAMLTNPIWVVKTRMFATPPSTQRIPAPNLAASASPSSSTSVSNDVRAYRGLWDGLRTIYMEEGVRGLYKGAGLALVGVSNGAIQFTAYEQLKKWRSNVVLRKRGAGADAEAPEGGVKLSNTEYILMSGASKMVAIFLTYPYQVVRSRIQNNATRHLYPSIPVCIKRTYTQEGGFRAFYKGLAANTVRILPGTCVTFVVYEQIAWALKGAAQDSLKRKKQADEEERDRKRIAALLFRQRGGTAAIDGDLPSRDAAFAFGKQDKSP